jgi:hypothetical protein
MTCFDMALFASLFREIGFIYHPDVVIAGASAFDSVGSDRLGIVYRRRPKKHLNAILVQNPQAIGILRHVQSVEQ